MQLRVDIEEAGSSRIVRLAGECDLATAPQLREALLPLRGPEVDEVIIDASELDFLDSTGLGVIIGALKRLRETDGAVKIAGANGSVLRVLEVTGIDRIIPLHADVDAARG